MLSECCEELQKFCQIRLQQPGFILSALTQAGDLKLHEFHLYYNNTVVTLH